MNGLLSGISVLLVTDDDETLDTIGMHLLRAGAFLHLCSRADDARRALDAPLGLDRPDVLLADCSLPDGDGYGLLEWMRARDGCGERCLPALALASEAFDAERGAAFLAFFRKPIESPELLVLAVYGARHARRTRSG